MEYQEFIEKFWAWIAGVGVVGVITFMGIVKGAIKTGSETIGNTLQLFQKKKDETQDAILINHNNGIKLLAIDKELTELKIKLHILENKSLQVANDRIDFLEIERTKYV